MEEPTPVEMAIIANAWCTVQAQWQVEKRRPLRTRRHFQVGEIAEALAENLAALE
jgi:hypothetical protein